MAEKILFVDDEVAVLEGCVRLLRQDFKIEIASSGAQALSMLSANGPYAVVVADMRMPEMDGAQLLSKIAVKFPQVLRIVLTGNQDMETAKRAVNEGGIFRLLTKPCEKEQLASALNAALVQYRLALIKSSSAPGGPTLLPRLRGKVDSEIAQATTLACEIMKTSATVRRPATEAGVYVGRVVWEGQETMLQAISATVVILHPKGTLASAPQVGDMVRIEYTSGKAIVQLNQ